MNKNQLSDILSLRAAYLNATNQVAKDTPAIVRFIRTKKNWTQKELADYLKVQPTYVSHLETGRRPLSWRIVSELNRLLTE